MVPTSRCTGDSLSYLAFSAFSALRCLVTRFRNYMHGRRCAAAELQLAWSATQTQHRRDDIPSPLHQLVTASLLAH